MLWLLSVSLAPSIVIVRLGFQGTKVKATASNRFRLFGLIQLTYITFLSSAPKSLEALSSSKQVVLSAVLFFVAGSCCSSTTGGSASGCSGSFDVMLSHATMPFNASVGWSGKRKSRGSGGMSPRHPRRVWHQDASRSQGEDRITSVTSASIGLACQPANQNASLKDPYSNMKVEHRPFDVFLQVQLQKDCTRQPAQRHQLSQRVDF